MYECSNKGSLDYLPCRYGRSRLLFRGPRRKLDGAYCVMLGGSETYGKFVERPFPALVETATGSRVVNMGWVNAGVDAFAGDPAVLDVCAGARLTVMQVLGAQNMSNRFYAVHPRRNDRFLRASALMKTVFREVDFTEFAFTRHMLTRLHEVAPDKFTMIEQELKSAWLARMKQLAARVPGKTVLLHVAGADPEPGQGLGPDPLFIDADMIAEVRQYFTEYVAVTPSPAARAAGTEGMVFPLLDAPAAAGMPGPRVHAEIATALSPTVSRLMG